MSFEIDEMGVQTSQPREAYAITTPAETYRLASGVHDVTIDGNVYTASPVSRASIVVPNAGGSGDLSFTLPVSHAVPQRVLELGVPPRSISVVVYRQQATSGESEAIWRGVVTSMACTGNLAEFRVASRLDRLKARRLPTISFSRICPHILYDNQCTVARASFTVSTTVAIANGRVVSVASMSGNPDGWATHGEILHVASGERMTIADQTGTSLTLQLPLVGIATGDAVQIFAGCDHQNNTCRDKFDNISHFGGFPQLPTINPWTPTGFGLKTEP